MNQLPHRLVRARCWMLMQPGSVLQICALITSTSRYEQLECPTRVGSCRQFAEQVSASRIILPRDNMIKQPTASSVYPACRSNRVHRSHASAILPAEVINEMSTTPIQSSVTVLKTSATRPTSRLTFIKRGLRRSCCGTLRVRCNT